MIVDFPTKRNELSTKNKACEARNKSILILVISTLNDNSLNKHFRTTQSVSDY